MERLQGLAEEDGGRGGRGRPPRGQEGGGRQTVKEGINSGSHLSYACLGRGARDEVRVYYFVRLYPLGGFEIIQVYAAMVAHLSRDTAIGRCRSCPP